MIRVPSDREILDMPCRCCGMIRVRLVIDLGNQPLCNRLVRPGVADPPSYPLRLGRCENCTMLQIDHTIPRDDMFREYVYVSGTTATLRQHFEARTAEIIRDYGVGPRDLVVDIGSNDGTWLKTWPKGVVTVGVEPSDVADQAIADGVNTITAYFDEAMAENLVSVYCPAKVITSNGSFFHMEDLHGACEGVRKLLAHDGVFVCGAIGGDDMIRGNAFDQVLHEHLLYYTPVSFSWLMSLHGLEVFKTIHHPIHGGTWEYHVRRARGEADFAGLATVSFDECDQFAHRVLTMRDELLSVLNVYRSMGERVWAYGAPGKGGTLLNSFGIGPDLVQCATEKNPRKFGLEIPGCRVPIVPEDMGRPDAYLVLAWNFLDEFLDKEGQWLASGGHFIVPVPDVRILP